MAITDTPPVTPARPVALVFIMVTAFVDLLSYGLVIPVLPKLIMDLAGGDAAHGATMFGLFTAAWAVMHFIFSPLLGALSDRYGRRPIILLSCFGLSLNFAVMALAPNLTWLFISRVLTGISAANFATAGAYLADVTPPEKRAANFGLLGAAYASGFILGPALGGVIGEMGPRLPFWVAAGLSLLNSVYGLLVLPESLPPERRSRFLWSRASPWGSLKLLRSHPQLSRLASVLFLSQFAGVVISSTAVLYMGYRYQWGTGYVGLVLTGVGACSVIVQALVGPVVKMTGERVALLMGLSFSALGFVIYGAASTGSLFWFGTPFVALGGLAGASMQSLMSHRVSVTEQGQLQGANSCLNSISGMIGPSVFTQIFSFSISSPSWQLPGLVFFFAAAILIGSAILASRYSRS